MNIFNNLGVNKVLLLGKVNKVPRRHIINNVPFICFALVTQEFIKRNGEKVKHLEYHSIKVPASCLEADINIAKGDNLYIQGKIQTQGFTDEFNVKRYKTEVIAYIIQPFNEETLKAENNTNNLNMYHSHAIK